MRIDKFTYASVEACLYEATRAIKAKETKKIDPEREGKALIDPELTPFNLTYIHSCLQPLADHKPGKGYERGTAIAEYHNSQVSNAYHHAAITGDAKHQSKAMGVILTMPKDYMQEIIPDLTDDEYEYLTYKLEAEGCGHAFTKNKEIEASIKEKTSRIHLTEEQMEKAKDFLLKGKDSVLEVLGIRIEDVLFWSIHFDESFPHIHIMALPTLEKTYEEDVYNRRNGKLLHKKGDVDISYNAGQYFEKGKAKGQNFYDRFHEEVIEKMAEKGIDASGLLNGATKGDGYSPTDLNHEQREESVQSAMTILALKKKIKQLEEEKEKAVKDTTQAVADKEAMTAEFKEIQDGFREQIRAAKAESVKAEAKAQEMQAIIEEKEIEISEKAKVISDMRDIIRELKLELKNLAKEVALFIPNLINRAITAWRDAKTQAERTEINGHYVAKATEKVKEAATPLEKLAERAEALSEEKELIAGIDMATFVRTDQKVGFAKKQIQKTAVNRGLSDLSDEELDTALDDWFNIAKYQVMLAHMSEDEAKAFMKPSERAERALEYALDIEREGVIER